MAAVMLEKREINLDELIADLIAGSHISEGVSGQKALREEIAQCLECLAERGVIGRAPRGDSGCSLVYVTDLPRPWLAEAVADGLRASV